MHNLGGAWTGFGAKITEDAPLPSYISAGVVYKIIKPLTFALDFQQPFNMRNLSKSEQISGAFGVEYFITDFFALQTGLLIKGLNPKISFGSAFFWKNMLFNVSYSLDLTSSLQPLNKISLAVKMHLGDSGRQKRTNTAYSLYEEGL